MWPLICLNQFSYQYDQDKTLLTDDQASLQLRSRSNKPLEISTVIALRRIQAKNLSSSSADAAGRTTC